MNTEKPDNGEQSPDEDSQEEELSLFDDPSSILFIDPNEEIVELSAGDTQEMTLPQRPDIQVITLNTINKEELLRAVRKYHNVITAFPKKTDEEILRAHYILVVLDTLLRKENGIIFKDTVRNILKDEDYPLTNSRYDEGVIDNAFIIVHSLNEHGI